MCDCYNHKCETEDCEKTISMHIGDFCTDRENVHVYCDKCSEKIFKTNQLKIDEKFIKKTTQRLKKKFETDNLILEEVDSEHQVALGFEPVGKVGNLVIIYWDDDKAYHIHLN